jgi:uncharacterized protein with HEPN domain
MKYDIQSCCTDFLREIAHIEAFMQGCTTLADFKQNSMRKKAVLHSLIVIGEAANRLRKLDSAVSINHIHNIVGLRNHLTHAYDVIEDSIVYGTVLKHLPLLKQEATAPLLAYS